MLKVTYLERRPITRFTCVDVKKTVILRKAWISGGLLYGYTDRFNVVAIATEMIIDKKEM